MHQGYQPGALSSYAIGGYEGSANTWLGGYGGSGYNVARGGNYYDVTNSSSDITNTTMTSLILLLTLLILLLRH